MDWGVRGWRVPDLRRQKNPDSHVEIPEGHLPGTGRMTPRSAGRESGRREEAHHAWTELRGSGMCRRRLDRVLEARERGLGHKAQGRQDGSIAWGGGWRQNDPRGAKHRAWCSAHGESWGLRSGPEENGARAMRASGGETRLQLGGKSESSGTASRGPNPGTGFPGKTLEERWENAPGASRPDCDSNFKPQTYSTATRSPCPPALLFVSQSAGTGFCSAAEGGRVAADWLMPVPAPTQPISVRQCFSTRGRNKRAGIKGGQEKAPAGPDTHQ